MQRGLTDAELKDRDIGGIRPEDLLARPEPNANGSLQAVQLFQQWKAMSREQTDETRDKEVLRDRLRLVLRAEYPRSIETSIDEDLVTLTRPEAGDPRDWLLASR